jgi:protein-tyrosine phosphatase
VIDLHTHVLPKVDDGVSSIDEATELGRAAEAAGVVALAATPHVRADFPTSPEQMEQGVAKVAKAFRKAGLSIRVLSGAELSFESVVTHSNDDLRRFGLGGNPDALLVEFPYAGWPVRFISTLQDLRARGFLVVLAHPERNAEIQAAPERLRQAVATGALVQITTASLAGAFGRRARRAALDLVEIECAHLVASDAHDATSRLLGREALAGAIDDERAEWLTTGVPSAIVEGTPLPSRPTGPAGRNWLRRLGRSEAARSGAQWRG